MVDRNLGAVSRRAPPSGRRPGPGLCWQGGTEARRRVDAEGPGSCPRVCSHDPAARPSPPPDPTRIAAGLRRHDVLSTHARQAHLRERRWRFPGRPRCRPVRRPDRAPGRCHLHRQLHPAQETGDRLDLHPFVGARPSPTPRHSCLSLACEPDAQDRQPQSRPGHPHRRRRPPLSIRRDRSHRERRNQEHGALLGQQRRLSGVRRRADFTESGPHRHHLRPLLCPWHSHRRRPARHCHERDPVGSRRFLPRRFPRSGSGLAGDQRLERPWSLQGCQQLPRRSGGEPHVRGSRSLHTRSRPLRHRDPRQPSLQATVLEDRASDLCRQAVVGQEHLRAEERPPGARRRQCPRVQLAARPERVRHPLHRPEPGRRRAMVRGRGRDVPEERPPSLRGRVQHPGRGQQFPQPADSAHPDPGQPARRHQLRDLGRDGAAFPVPLPRCARHRDPGADRRAQHGVRERLERVHGRQAGRGAPLLHVPQQHRSEEDLRIRGRDEELAGPVPARHGGRQPDARHVLSHSRLQRERPRRKHARRLLRVSRKLLSRDGRRGRLRGPLARQLPPCPCQSVQERRHRRQGPGGGDRRARGGDGGGRLRRLISRGERGRACERPPPPPPGAWRRACRRSCARSSSPYPRGG